MSKFKKLMSGIAVTSALSLVFTASVDAKQYTVKKGDTLYSIAKKNNTTVAKVVSDNKIVNGVIKPGQVLNVGGTAPKATVTTKAPVKATSQTATSGQHKIVKGDTLYSVARKNGMTLDELKKLNNLSSNYVPVGRVLNVRKSSAVAKPVVTTTTKKAVVTTKKAPVTTKAPTTTKVPVTTKAPTAVKVNSTTVKGQHKVVKGDTLYNIAKRNGMTVDELKKLNNLTSNNVSLGRVLTVNKPATSVPKPVTVTTTKKVETTKKTSEKPAQTTTTKT
ncbi:MAG: LysM peptidoglycan-binding domain-containing protein, partial [Gemella sp.]|nr:LysM peptidoglycan-binding domain-containing protein [Gemella sp.]